ncbi:hypothetical protein IWX90DRAFT_432039 [Phyllosticta citrichinensis]|uniref:Uncharacterized protein n=1 Tax=Phyllosticta citrichinensis TaxID=1130410 RepID=A0ABR1XXU9_9PEZI
MSSDHIAIPEGEGVPNGDYDTWLLEENLPEYDRLLSQEDASQAILQRSEDDIIHPHLEELFRGYEFLLQLIWAEEKRPEGGRDMFFQQGRNILASTDNQVLQSFIKGTIPEEMVGNSNPHLKKFLRDALTEMQMQEEGKQYRPVIYSQYLVNSNGKSPTVDEVKDIVTMVRRYIDGGPADYQWARQIDTAKTIVGKKDISWNQGGRRYLGTKYPAARKDKAKAFCMAVTTRCEGRAGNSRPRPFSDVGYTNNARTRLRDHSRHVSSNWLMNLVEAICLVHFPSYKIEQFVIYRIWDYFQSSVAEILFNRLAQSPIETGFGFAYCAAGHSVFSSGNVLSRIYSLWSVDALISTPLLGKTSSYDRKGFKVLAHDRKC